jgi:transcription-repair coupling factor (superfamily II helicase)
MKKVKKISFGNKPFLGLVDYILTEELGNNNAVGIIFDSEIDLYQAENLFLGWENILNQIGVKKVDIEKIFIGKQISSLVKDRNKIVNCYDDIVNILKIQMVKNKTKNFCIATKKDVLDLGLEISYDLLEIFVGEEITYETITLKLTELGYRRVNYVETIGEYSIRGEIFDIWPNTIETHRMPYRIIFDENKVVEIKIFDVATQKSIKNITSETVQQIIVYPVEIKINQDNNTNLNSIFTDLDIVLEISDQIPQSLELEDYSKTIRYYNDTTKFLVDLKNFLVQ